MAVTSVKNLSPFSEVIRFTAEGVTAVNLGAIPAGTLITSVWCRIVTAASGTAGNMTIGDDDSSNGFILAFDGQGAAGTVYGDDTTEQGAYLYDGTKKGGQTKYYSTAKSLFGVMSGASTGGVYDVIVRGLRYDPT